MKIKQQTIKEEFFLERFKKLYEPIQLLDFIKTESPDYISANINDRIVELEEKEFILSHNIPPWAIAASNTQHVD